MKNERYEIINKYISNWNLLNVPIEIAENEYTDFIPLIYDVIFGIVDDFSYIEEYIIDLVGEGFENNQIFIDTNQILNSIKIEINEKGLR